jgi:transposase
VICQLFLSALRRNAYCAPHNGVGKPAQGPIYSDISIPTKSNERQDPAFDREAYRRRNWIERLINRLKQFRRIAT